MANGIAFKNVTKAFYDPSRHRKALAYFFEKTKKNSRILFQDLSFEISLGEKILFVGRNGAGKTTLLKLAGGFIHPDSGTISIGELSVQKVDRSLFGVMLSTQLLYPKLTGYQNLEHSAYLYGCDNIEARIERKIQQWQLNEVVDHCVETYSNGRKILLALARATIHDPTILLLDEPTAFLDSTNLELLACYLKETQSTLLITTQEPNFFDGIVNRVISL